MCLSLSLQIWSQKFIFKITVLNWIASTLCMHILILLLDMRERQYIALAIEGIHVLYHPVQCLINSTSYYLLECINMHYNLLPLSHIIMHYHNHAYHTMHVSRSFLRAHVNESCADHDFWITLDLPTSCKFWWLPSIMMNVECCKFIHMLLAHKLKI